MRKLTICFGLTILILAVTSISLLGQSPRKVRSRAESPPPQGSQTAAPEPTPPESSQVETLKIDTNLVTIPVIATDAGGLFVGDLRQEEFNIFEDDIKQDIAFFATVNTPFQVILMIDTSASTEGKLRQIQDAAVAFVDQLKPADRVKVISFDNELRDLNEFTNDRQELRSAIMKTRSGQGTRLYDAVDLALSTIRPIQGRKAIVLFTDGVDYHSDSSTFDGTLRGLDEEGVIVYPIRYDTRVETERIAREQAGEQLPTLSVIRTQPSGTTAPTFPSDEPSSVPNVNRSRGILGLPSPDEILRGTRRNDPRYPDPNGGGIPPDDRARRSPDPNDPRNVPPGSTSGTAGRDSANRDMRRTNDTISAMLDGLYATADSYLEKLAAKSGGHLLRADTLRSLPDAFGKIAAELRTQYSLGYYPTNRAHDGRYRKVKVVINRKGVMLRARPGYSAPAN